MQWWVWALLSALAAATRILANWACNYPVQSRDGYLHRGDSDIRLGAGPGAGPN
jgi:hypothetical protein